MDFETRYLPADSLRLEAAEDSRTPRIAGYAIVFDEWSEIISEDGVRFRERIAPTAVKKALADGADVRALVNHDSQKLLGRSKAGTLRYTVDNRGVYIEVDPPQTSYANDAIESIRRGDMSGMSFQFRSAKGSDTWEQRDGLPHRTVNNIDLIREFSVVTFPAYPSTDVALRSLREYEANTAALMKMRLAIAEAE